MRAEASSASTSNDPSSTSAVARPPQPHLPSTYRRLVARVPAPSFRSGAQIEEITLPATLEEGQVLVKIAVAGVNGGCETFRVRAEAGTPFARKNPPSFSSSDSDSLPVPLGAEGAGTVVAVGPGVRPSQLSVGDRVTVNGGSAFAEFVAVAARGCFKAVALSLSGLTAAVALHATAKVQPGETVLVTAAAGGTGHLAMQLAALVPGCRVVAVAGGEKKVAKIRRELSRIDPENERGHAVVDYKAAADDLPGAISEALLMGRRESGGEGEGKVKKENFGVDVCYEGVGGRVRAAALRNLNRGARVLCVGYMGSYPHTEDYKKKKRNEEEEESEPETETVFVSAPLDAPPRGAARSPLEPDLFWNRKVVRLPGDRTAFGDVWSGAAGDPRTLARLRRNLFAAAEKGELVPWIDDGDRGGEGTENDSSSSGPFFYGLEAASDAVERLLSGESMGKVVLRVSGGGDDGEW